MATITIRNLDEDVKQRLRIRAARNGRSMEAEARLILTRSSSDPQASESEGPRSVADAVRGRWKGRGTTDEVMRQIRGA